MIRVAVTGAAGRLASTVLHTLDSDPRFEIATCLVRPNSAIIGDPVPLVLSTELTYQGSDGEWGNPQVLLDASTSDAVAGHAERAAREGIALLIAVTGLSDQAREAVDRASGRVPLLVAPNLSLGVNVLVRLVREAAKKLPGFQVEILETHHAAKRDSPSGTAQWLAREVAELRGWPWLDAVRMGRTGETGPRPEQEIGIHSVRAGTTVGEHRVRLGGQGEYLELSHIAESRNSFAAGAMEALAFLASVPPGRYNMEDVLDGR